MTKYIIVIMSGDHTAIPTDAYGLYETENEAISEAVKMAGEMDLDRNTGGYDCFACDEEGETQLHIMSVNKY